MVDLRSLKIKLAVLKSARKRTPNHTPHAKFVEVWADILKVNDNWYYFIIQFIFLLTNFNIKYLSQNLIRLSMKGVFCNPLDEQNPKLSWGVQYIQVFMEKIQKTSCFIIAKFPSPLRHTEKTSATFFMWKGRVQMEKWINCVILLEIFIDKTTDLENYSYKGGFVEISAILKPAV